MESGEKAGSLVAFSVEIRVDDVELKMVVLALASCCGIDKMGL